ncbi:hypothetical protein MTO96_027145 [Rhipicephalus appendiculatus]
MALGSWNRCGGRPPIFEYYVTEFPLPEEGNFRAICKVCNTSISASRRATSNLISHMKASSLSSRANVFARPVGVVRTLVTPLLAGSLLDPGIVDTREFRRLLSLLDTSYEPPTASQLVYGLLPGRRWGLQQRAMLLLETAQSVALTQV